ncbi:hypothetical protein H4219_006184 [Mycoemilia scoparia]|uniref:Uncharacterized protein n=1 Tax=Mycoemilia scoparia TaxID=417184 RepID=A0A9W8DMQ6_9FUNG|nr:hypothetical protein H4219_006184 [Mycoemilia scoparia]
MAYSAETIGFMAGVVFVFAMVMSICDIRHRRREQEYNERYLIGIPKLRIFRETFGPFANTYNIPAGLCKEALRKWPYCDCGLTYFLLINLLQDFFQYYKATQLDEITIQIPATIAKSLGLKIGKLAWILAALDIDDIRIVKVVFKITCTTRSKSVSFFSIRVLNEFVNGGTIFSGVNVNSKSGKILTDEEAEEIVNSEAPCQTEEPNNALSEIDQYSCAVKIPEQCNDASTADCGSDFEVENEASPLVAHKNGSIKPQANYGSSSSASAASPPLENLKCTSCTDDIVKFTNHICYPNVCCCGQEYYCMDCIKTHGHTFKYCIIITVEGRLRKKIPMREFLESVGVEIAEISRPYFSDDTRM